jgi:hypothetical protein
MIVFKVTLLEGSLLRERALQQLPVVLERHPDAVVNHVEEVGVAALREVDAGLLVSVKVARPKVSQGSKAQGISGYLKGCHGIYERYLSRLPNYVFQMIRKAPNISQGSWCNRSSATLCFLEGSKVFGATLA